MHFILSIKFFSAARPSAVRPPKLCWGLAGQLHCAYFMCIVLHRGAAGVRSHALCHTRVHCMSVAHREGAVVWCGPVHRVCMVRRSVSHHAAHTSTHRVKVQCMSLCVVPCACKPHPCESMWYQPRLCVHCASVRCHVHIAVTSHPSTVGVHVLCVNHACNHRGVCVCIPCVCVKRTQPAAIIAPSPHN